MERGGGRRLAHCVQIKTVPIHPLDKHDKTVTRARAGRAYPRNTAPVERCGERGGARPSTPLPTSRRRPDLPLQAPLEVDLASVVGSPVACEWGCRRMASGMREGEVHLWILERCGRRGNHGYPRSENRRALWSPFNPVLTGFRACTTARLTLTGPGWRGVGSGVEGIGKGRQQGCGRQAPIP